MVTEDATPNTLLGAIKYFADVEVSIGFVAALRWPDGAICPQCDGNACYRLSTRPLWKCRACKKQFSVKVGSIFEDSPIGLDKWLPAMWMLVNCKNGVSSYEIARDLGVTQKTAWFMLHRLRLAIQTKSFEKIGGTVEVDETFIGGKARNMHRAKHRRVLSGQHGTVGKVAVMGLLERHGKDGHSTIRTAIVPNTKRHPLHGEIRKHVTTGATVNTDALRSYRGLDDEYIHNVIDHAEQYVDGQIHTNGCENFWSLLKRSLKGTYVSVEPFHLFRYLDEQAYRFNNRKASDGYRFLQAMASVFGKRLTFRVLTGKDLPQTC